MCILFLYTDPQPSPKGYRFIAASNRDEFYRRPAQCARLDEHIIGGKDLESNRAGGMWLGVSLKETDRARLRFGALLNVTGEDRKQSKGRGFIVSNYLTGELEAQNYADILLSSGEPYNAFNFVAVEISENGGTATYDCSNTPVRHESHQGKQYLGFGNTTPNRPLTKVKAGINRFKEVVDECNDVMVKADLISKLLDLLKSESKHLPDEELERRQPEAYECLSCIFVKMAEAGYGTRTHSIVTVDHDWNVEFHEVTMDDPIDPHAPVWKTNVIKARL